MSQKCGLPAYVTHGCEPFIHAEMHTSLYVDLAFLYVELGYRLAASVKETSSDLLRPYQDRSCRPKRVSLGQIALVLKQARILICCGCR